MNTYAYSYQGLPVREGPQPLPPQAYNPAYAQYYMQPQRPSTPPPSAYNPGWGPGGFGGNSMGRPEDMYRQQQTQGYNFGAYNTPNTPNLNVQAATSGISNTPTGAGSFGTSLDQLLQKPRDAALSALSGMGLNPYGNSAAVQRVMKQAQDLLSQVPIQLALSGAQGTDALNMVPQYIQNQLQRALTGQSVYFSPNQSQGILGALDRMASQAGPTTTAMNPLVGLAQNLTSTEGLGDTLTSLLYGGMNPSVARMFTQGLQDLPSLIGRASTRDVTASPLQLLMSGRLNDPSLWQAGNVR